MTQKKFQPDEQQAIPLVLSSTPKPLSPCDCGCSEVRAFLSSNPTHYASWHCKECDRFRGWIPKPTSLITAQAENALIDKLLESGNLNDWELEFCQSLKGLRKRSPRQRKKLQDIANRLGQQQIVQDGGSHLFSQGGEG